MSSFPRLPLLSETDIISLSALHLAATVGPDHWHRTRPQPIHLTLHLHLPPTALDTPGQSDNVADSLHYGHLAKAVERRVSARAEIEGGGPRTGYPGARALVEDVTDAALAFGLSPARDEGVRMVHAVRVVLALPKQILLAGGFEVELTTRASDWTPRPASGSGSGSGSTAGAIVRVTDLVLPVLIGVNPPERLAKQRVVTHLTFFEAARANTVHGEMMDYPAIVQQVATDVERTTYLTLEKLVYEIIRTAYRASDAQLSSDSNLFRIDAITVRCQKPSALSFADASGVEMTRTREALRLAGR